MRLRLTLDAMVLLDVTVLEPESDGEPVREVTLTAETQVAPFGFDAAPDDD